MTKKIAFLAIASLLPLAAHASPILTYDTASNSTTEEGALGISADLQFSISGNVLTVVVTNTEANEYEDSQNVSAISFKLEDGNTALTATSVSTSAASVVTTTGTALHGTVANSSLPSTNWTQTPTGSGMPDGSLTAPGQIQAYSVVGTPGSQEDKYSITADGSVATGSSGATTWTPPTSNCINHTPTADCGTGTELGTNTNDSPEIYGQATFTFVLSQSLGVSNTFTNGTNCGSNNFCVSNVVVGFGPDGPDADDVAVTNFTSSTNPSTTPEPSSLLLLGTGILGAAGIFHRRAKKVASV